MTTPALTGYGTVSSASQETVTTSPFASNVGDLIIVYVQFFLNGISGIIPAGTVTDSAGNQYQQIVFAENAVVPPSVSFSQAVYAAIALNTQSSLRVTGSIIFSTVAAYEFGVVAASFSGIPLQPNSVGAENSADAKTTTYTTVGEGAGGSLFLFAGLQSPAGTLKITTPKGMTEIPPPASTNAITDVWYSLGTAVDGTNTVTETNSTKTGCSGFVIIFGEPNAGPQTNLVLTAVTGISGAGNLVNANQVSFSAAGAVPLVPHQ